MQGFRKGLLGIGLTSPLFLLLLVFPSSLKLFPQVVVAVVQPERGRRNSPGLLLHPLLLPLEVGQSVAQAADKGGSLLVRERGGSIIRGGEFLLLEVGGSLVR